MDNAQFEIGENGLPVLSHRMSYQPKANPTKVVARIPVPNEVAHTKSFSFSRHGGVEQAIAAALEYTNWMGPDLWGDLWKPVGYIRKHGGSNKGKTIKRSRTHLGLVTGVNHKMRLKNEVMYYCWVATWSENGKSKQKEFPYGTIRGKVIDPETARAEATKLRLKMVMIHTK